MITTEYDGRIKNAAEQHFPGVDWRMIKAQLIQESGLRPDAVSPAGAQGIAQFMPGTWRDMQKKMQLPREASPFEPDFAIPACCFFMDRLYKGWSYPRPAADRLALALASYNAGFGNLIKAQRLAGGASDYASIINKLDRVTGFANARETRGYTINIFNYYSKMVLAGTL